MVSFLFFGGKVQHRKIFDGHQYFLLMVRFCVVFGTTNLGLSVQIVIKLFFEQFLKLQRRRDVVNLMPKKLIVVASNFFCEKTAIFWCFFWFCQGGDFLFFLIIKWYAFVIDREVRSYPVAFWSFEFQNFSFVFALNALVVIFDMLVP